MRFVAHRPDGTDRATAFRCSARTPVHRFMWSAMEVANQLMSARSSRSGWRGELTGESAGQFRQALQLGK